MKKNNNPDMLELCRRLETWLGKNFPTGLADLNPGATDEEITEHERTTGFELPDDVRAWFRWRNGQRRWAPGCEVSSILFGDELLSLEDSLREWKEWQSNDVTSLNEEIAEQCTSRPADAIIAAYSLPGWIPLAQSPAISNYLGIDLNPGPKGTKGQIINFGRDGEEKCVAASSLAYFLELIVEEMESGRVTVGVPSGTDQGDLPWTVHSFSYVNLYGQNMSFLGFLFRLHDLGKFDGRRLHVDASMEHIVPLPRERGERLRLLHLFAINREFDKVREILGADPELIKYCDPGVHDVAFRVSPQSK